MTYADRINKEISELRLQNPNHEIFPILERYNPAEKPGGSCLALFSLGFDAGIIPSYTRAFVSTDTGESDGVAATLIFKPANIAGRAEGEVELKGFPAGEQGLGDCLVYGTLRQLEEMMRIPRLHERLQGRNSK